MRLLPSLLTSSTLAAAAFLRPPSLTARPWQWLHEPEEQHVFRTRPQSATADPASHGEIAFPHRPSRPVAGFVALGDSYSAGIGTGLNGTEDECRRGLHAHPRLIQADLNTTTRGHDAAPPALQFLSCTGSTIEDMLSGAPNSQIDAFNTSLPADFALLSIGGNDLGFFDIMNSCIFRFYSFYSGTCDEALRRSEEALTGPEFEHGLRLAIMEILDRVKWEKNPWFSIFVTGYARFFNADTNECDESSFGVWWRGPKLKRDLRQRMNRMVLRVNDKIRRSVDAINAGFTKPRVTFVDYDDAFEGHRFCERNTTEPDYGRNETWFFLVGGQDNSATNQSAALNAASAHAVPLSPSSPLIDPELCLGPAEKSGDWGKLALCMMAMAAKEDPTLKTRHGDMVAENSMWYVPTYYGKTFHPRTLGHMAIRDRIYRLWEERQQNETQGKN